MFHHVPLVIMSGPGGEKLVRSAGPFSADVYGEPPGCTNSDHKRAEGTAMTNVTFYKHWQVNMPSCRKHFAIIMVHSLRALPIDINSSIVQDALMDSTNIHHAPAVVCNTTTSVTWLLPSNVHLLVHQHHFPCVQISAPKAASIMRQQCLSPLMC